MNAIAVPSIHRAVLTRVILAIAAAAITYAVLIAWQLGGTLRSWADALMQRSSVSHPAQTIGAYWQWLALASCGALIASLLFRVQLVRVTLVAWLAITAVFAGISWATFGPDSVTPFALLGACGCAYWLQRTTRAA